MKAKGKLPLPRASSAFCYDGNGCIYLIGGMNGPRGEIYKDMHKFHIETKTWTTVEVIDETADSAFGMYGQSMSRFRQSLYIFGGCRGSRYCQETFLYDIPSKRIKILDCWGHNLLHGINIRVLLKPTLQFLLYTFWEVVIFFLVACILISIV